MGTSWLPKVLPCMLILFSLSSVVFSQTPTVSVTQATYSGVPGGTVTLVCSVSSTASITSAFWYRDRGGTAITVTNGGKYSFPIGTNPSLTITSLTNDDTGSYRCFAGTATSQIGQSGSTYLTVATPNVAPVVQHPQASYTQDVGGSFTIGCVISANPGATSVVWTKNSATITIDGSKYQNGNTATPSLLIADLVLADAGTFVCGATNAFGSAQTTGATLTVTGSVPVLSTPTTSVTANSGTSITLQCSIQSANPSVTSVTWRFVPSAGGATTNINSATNGYTGSTTANPSLTITSVSSANAGTYTCGAVNAAGPGQGLPITLTVTGTRPTVSIPQTSYSTLSGGTVILTCSISSNPFQTVVTWQKLVGTVYQQVQITSNSRYSGGTTTSPNLVITGALTTDSGTYQCTATNQFGTSQSGTTQLTISGTTPTVTVGATSYSVTIGTTFTLQCTVSSTTTITNVFWRRLINGVTSTITIDNVNYSGGSTSTPSLTIIAASASDSGTYTCFASNVAGTGSATTQLIVTGSKYYLFFSASKFTEPNYFLS
ncbi:hemicentin-1-like isoform X3 [Pecten maximus]|uniref:hemicentin-1-like isoform X3 n=1 Tax=Pecten maximus TaxID=6579 RepID=UPI001458EDCF|nr:hemicentin-1-like isoform X3 [Pecten maximus]